MEVFKYWLDSSDNIKELEIVRQFKSHGVVKERVELYRDFSINLLHYIYDSYLGSEYIKSESDILGHFSWAYLKVLNEFEDEGINFYCNDGLFDYFFTYYYDQFYKIDRIQRFSYYEKFWNSIFEVKRNKQRKIFEVLLELYEIFDKSFILKNKYEEIYL